MNKKKNEGVLIALTVIAAIAAAAGAWILLKWLVQFFFPTLF